MYTLLTIVLSGAFFGFLGYWWGFIRGAIQAEYNARFKCNGDVYERVCRQEVDEFEIVLN